MKRIEIEFVGSKADEMARKLYTYLVDGGLEDQLVGFLSDDDTDVSMSDWDNEKLKVTFESKSTDKT